MSVRFYALSSETPPMNSPQPPFAARAVRDHSTGMAKKGTRRDGSTQGTSILLSPLQLSPVSPKARDRHASTAAYIDYRRPRCVEHQFEAVMERENRGSTELAEVQRMRMNLGLERDRGLRKRMRRLRESRMPPTGCASG